jgi:site-specific recombinase XerD
MKKLKDKKLFELIQNYLCDYLPNIRHRSKDTVKSSRDSINELLLFFEKKENIQVFDVTIDLFNINEICKFGEWLLAEQKLKASSANQRISRIKTFAGYLVGNYSADKVIILNRISEFTKYQVVEDISPKSLTLKQIKILLSQPNLNNSIEFRDCFFMSLMYDSGCRDNEIRSLKLKNIQIDKSSIKILVLGKGNKRRLVPISSALLSYFQTYFSLFHKIFILENYLFYSSTRKGNNKMSNDNSLRIIKKYVERAKISDPDFPNAHCHTLRHSRAQNLYDHSMPLPLIGDLLGHASLNSTKVYAQASIELKKKEIEKAMYGINPLLEMEEVKYVDDEDILKQLYGLK